MLYFAASHLKGVAMNIRHWFLSAVLIVIALFPINARSSDDPDILRFSLSPPGDAARKFESEHAPLPKRKYWLNLSPVGTAKGYILHPDGSFDELSVINKDGDPMVAFDSPWKSESMHGPNNVYAFDRSVSADTLHIRTAKWIVIHHNCSWGHGYRFDEERLTPRPLSAIPLEIVPEPLWDGNFHVNTETGMTLTVRVMSYGKPVEDARLTLITDQGWQKEIRTGAGGRASFQLIRDYYPDTWGDFQRNRLGSLLFVARVERENRGVFDGRFYKREVLTTSLPWRYRPAKADYTSLVSGLAVGFTTFALSLTAVFIYRERRRKPVRRLQFDE